ncbi:hypothetical protein SDC9_141452 [bioreactor metagenome]|uniref:Uncharacterized protein n=1 Tax=bioreactor metagenome TaxID=1076179 RepID=A0A645DY86_9ZZZZ
MKKKRRLQFGGIAIWRKMKNRRNKSDPDQNQQSVMQNRKVNPARVCDTNSKLPENVSTALSGIIRASLYKKTMFV